MAITFKQLQAIREQRANHQRLQRIEATNRQIRRQLDVLEDPSLPQREINERVIRFAAAERAAGRKIDYRLARQVVLNSKPQQRNATKPNCPASRAELSAAAVRYALAEASRGNKITYAEARQRVLAG